MGSNCVADDALMLICPDWHPPSFVLDGLNGGVVYGNLPFLRALHGGETLQVLSDKIKFRSPSFDQRFKSLVCNMLKLNTETAIMIGRCPESGPILSVTVRNPQGFLRTVLERGTATSSARKRKLVVELRMADSVIDPAALDAFRDALDLNATELADLQRLLSSGLMDTTDGFKLSNRCDETVITKLQQFAGCLSPADLQRLILALSPLVPSYYGTDPTIAPTFGGRSDENDDDQ